MPPLTELRYYQLYGTGNLSYANYTQWGRFRSINGDGVDKLGNNLPFVVTAWSAQGYEVINKPDGSSVRGALIPAFATNGPYQTMSLPYSHNGFLGKAADTIYQILKSP